MRQYTKEFLKKFIPEGLLIAKRKYQANKKLSKGTKARKLLKFEIHLADNCNLNCKSCSHFSPLVEESYLDVETYNNDCKRISELSNGKIEGIRLMGGEPLLNPYIVDILNISRKYFDDATLDIVTNGILLPKQDNNFWETCKKNDIQIHISRYPIKINHDKIDTLAQQYGVKIVYLGGKEGLIWNDMELDLNGTQDIDETFRSCPQSNVCINLYKGKLYTCPTIAYIQYFNSYFGQNLSVSEKDYIDIYKAKSIEEILDFLSKPVPFCRYCNIKGQYQIEWSVSKREMREWVK